MKQILGTIVLIGTVIGTAVFGVRTYVRMQDGLALKDSLITLTQTLYAAGQSELESIHIENENLRKTVQAYKAKERAYLKLVAEYKAQAMGVATADTIIVRDTIMVGRRFASWVVPDELYLAGYFETTPPYTMNFQDIRLLLHPEIVLTETDKGLWNVFIETNSRMLSVKDYKLQVNPYKPPFMDLKPSVFLRYRWPQNELGLLTSVRIWRLYPFAQIASSYTSTSISIGVDARIW